MERMEILKKAAQDMNDKLGLEPKIDLTLPEEDLLARVKKEAEQIGLNISSNKLDPAVVEADKKNLDPGTWTFLKDEGALDHIKEVEKKGKTTKKTTKKTDKAAPKKETPEGKKTDKAAPKTPAEKTALGSQKNTQAGFIDELLLAGVERDGAARQIAAKFEVDEKKALGRFNLHKKFLVEERGIKITEKDGVFTAEAPQK